MNNNEVSAPDVVEIISHTPSTPSSANTAAVSPEKQGGQYFVLRGDAKEGPYTEEMLKSAAAAGKVQDSTYVWCEGMSEWQPYGQVFAAPSSANETQAALTVSMLKEKGDECMQSVRHLAEKILPLSKKIGEQALSEAKKGLEAVQNIDLKESYTKLQNHELSVRTKDIVYKYIPEGKRKLAAGIAIGLVAVVAVLCLTWLFSDNDENLAQSDEYFAQNDEDNGELDVRAIQKAAKRGEVDAQYKMGVIYLKGLGVEKDILEACKWWKLAAEQGDDESAFLLATMYGKGYKLHPNENATDEAIRWYTFAAQKGNARAQHDLGVYYVSISSDVRGIQLLKAAAEQGHPNALYLLGGFHFLGSHGVQQNVSKARLYLEEAAARGSKEAASALRDLGSIH